MNLTDRFKRHNSPPVAFDLWAQSLLRRHGLDDLWTADRKVLKFRFSASPTTHLSGVGRELLTICSLVKADDPVRPMALKALTDGCGLSYAALLDVLVEDGVMAEDEAVPSRFAALLLQNGLTGVEVDRVLRDWGETAKGFPPRAVARMGKALAQGVVVYETTFTPGPGAAVVRTERRKAVRVRPAGRVKA